MYPRRSSVERRCLLFVFGLQKKLEQAGQQHFRCVFQLRSDIKELESLLEKATRSKVQRVLTVELRKLQTEYIHKEEELKKASGDASTNGLDAVASAKPTVQSTPKGYTKEITTYGEW